MSNSQNIETLMDPTDISGSRLHAVDKGIELIEAAQQHLADSSSRRKPTHSLVGVSELPPDMWQQHADRFESVTANGTDQKNPLTTYIAPGSQDAGTVYNIEPTTELGFESPEELLRKARLGVQAATDALPRREEIN